MESSSRFELAMSKIRSVASWLIVVSGGARADYPDVAEDVQIPIRVEVLARACDLELVALRPELDRVPGRAAFPAGVHGNVPVRGLDRLAQ